LALGACNRNGESSAAEGGSGLAEGVVEVGAALTLPLVSEPVHFSVWSILQIPGIGMDTLSESYHFQELARRTNIHLDFIIPPAGGELEALNLLIAAGDLPDVLEMMPAGITWPGGFSAGINDGVLLDIAEIAERYAPYYWDIINDPVRARHSRTDYGHLPGFWQTMVFQPPWYGLTTRQDWLDELGLDTPITFDDWHHALTLFRDELGATAPMLVPNTGFPHMNSFTAAFGFTPGFFQVNGEVRFGPLEPGFKDYLIMMNQWFEEGLIDPDFSSRPFFAGPQDLTTTGISGLWQDVYVLLPVNAIVSPDPNFRSVAVPPPVLYHGQTLHFAQMNQPVDWIWVVTNENPNPALFARFMNYVYSPEGQMFSNFGIEGETFEFGPDGTPQFLPFIYDNPDGWSFPDALRRYVRPPMGGFYYDWRRELTPGIDADVLAAPDIWATNVDFAWLLPPITLSAEEGVENSRIMADVNTHRDEMVARFITGAESFDNFDAFLDTIRTMGIYRAIELQQGALDRFNAR